MDEATTVSGVDQVKVSEEVVRKAFSERFLNLDESDHEQLSKVLFPDTHKTDVPLLGKSRPIRPLSVKAGRSVYQALKPFALKQREAMKEGTMVDMTEDVLQALFATTTALADFYDWEDVKKAVVDETISMTEMQDLVISQEQIDGANNFLLGGLRVLINVMRLNEMVGLKYLSMLSSPSSARS